MHATAPSQINNFIYIIYICILYIILCTLYTILYIKIIHIIYLYMNIWYVYMYIYVCMGLCMYLYMYVYVYIYIYIYTTTEFRSGVLTDWAIMPWVQLALRANFLQPLQFHHLFSVAFYFGYCLHQSPRLF